MTYSVQVSNIASTTSDQTLHDFFTFCGSITRVEHDKSSQTATIHFEKSAAAKTALMLNGGTLDGSILGVASSGVRADSPSEDPVASGSGTSAGEHIHQEDKPRSGIAAEYLAKGYELGEPILQKAIDMDKQHGISTRFINYFRQFDAMVGSKVPGPEPTLSEAALHKSQTLNEKYHVTERSNTYYEKAVASSVGQKVYAFWTTTTKQVIDIHEEATRIKEAHKAAGTSAVPTSDTVPPAAIPGASIPSGSKA